jgi:hypothetical protein
MELSRQQVVDFMRSRGDEQGAERAEHELPETLQLPDDAGLLAQYGVKADDVDSGRSLGT